MLLENGTLLAGQILVTDTLVQDEEEESENSINDYIVGEDW